MPLDKDSLVVVVVVVVVVWLSSQLVHIHPPRRLAEHWQSCSFGSVGLTSTRQFGSFAF